MCPSSDPVRVRIIGLGNSLRGDDGVGPALVECLTATPLPSGVEAVDGGIGGLILLDLLEGLEAAVLVDAARFGRPAGTVLRLPGDALAGAEGAGCCDPHLTGVDGALALGRALGGLPRVVAFLVQVAEVDFGAGLSPAVAAALPDLAARVRREAVGLLR